MAGKASNYGSPHGKTNSPSPTSTPKPSHSAVPVADRTNPAHTANSTPLQPPSHNQKPTEESVRARAYELWEQAGRPEGDGVEYWLRAEKELSNPL